MNNEILYWVWLSLKKHVTPRIALELYAKYGSITDIFNENNYHNIHLMTERAEASLKDKDTSIAQKLIDDTHALGANIVVYDDEAYPPLLREISEPPMVLYVLGKLCLTENSLPIGIVGSRKCDKYGMEVTEHFAKQLALKGVATVSGMALGVDTIVAKNTIEVGGYTIAVLGSGLDRVYPKSNAGLMEQIAASGAVITEYPLGTPPININFPRRNRIIAGISKGLLVTEAPTKSGSLITANIALRENRDVYAVPGEIFSVRSTGCNALISASSAKLVQTTDDILVQYEGYEPIYQNGVSEFSTPKTEVEKEIAKADAPIANNLNTLDDDEKEIVAQLLKGDKTPDELVNILSKSIQDIKNTLFMLELDGIIEQKPGDIYGIIN